MNTWGGGMGDPPGMVMICVSVRWVVTVTRDKRCANHPVPDETPHYCRIGHESARANGFLTGLIPLSESVRD